MAVKGNIPDIGKPLILKLQKDMAAETEERKRADDALKDEIEAEKKAREEADKTLAAGAVIIKRTVVIPKAAWTEEDGGFKCDISMEEAGEGLFPQVALHEESMNAAGRAEVSTGAETLAGKVRLRAKLKPEADMTADIALTPDGRADI